MFQNPLISESHNSKAVYFKLRFTLSYRDVKELLLIRDALMM